MNAGCIRHSDRVQRANGIFPAIKQRGLASRAQRLPTEEEELAMKKIALIATGVLIATTAGAYANSIDDTRDRQSDRIEHGRQTGKITWTEGLRLRAEQKRIARTQSAYEDKGYLTKSERRTLKNMQSDAAEHISEEKSNGWSRIWWLPRVGK
jgi:hypothetical protein